MASVPGNDSSTGIPGLLRRALESFPGTQGSQQIWFQLTFLALSPNKKDPSKNTPYWLATAYGFLLKSPSQPPHLCSHEPPARSTQAPFSLPLWQVPAPISPLLWNAAFIWHLALPFTKFLYVDCFFLSSSNANIWEQNWTFSGSISVNKSSRKKGFPWNKGDWAHRGLGKGLGSSLPTGPFGKGGGRRDYPLRAQLMRQWGSQQIWQYHMQSRTIPRSCAWLGFWKISLSRMWA